MSGFFCIAIDNEMAWQGVVVFQRRNFSPTGGFVA
jgi:hypothetical protein